MKKSLFLLLLFILLLVPILTGCVNSSSHNESSNNNYYDGTGEDFAFYDLNGNVKHLSDYRGKIVLLDMWATWCKPCQYQMLELRKAYQNYSHDKLQILSINIDQRETIQNIEDFINVYDQYGYPLEWTFGREKDNLDKYMPEGAIPTLCIFDQYGHLYFTNTGVTFFSKEEIPSNWTGDKVTLKEKIDDLIT